LTSALPIIGILTKPTADCVRHPSKRALLQGDLSLEATCCFLSYYVKWIEAAGGQVVPILLNPDPAYLEKVYGNINGVLLTGGGIDLQVDSDYKTIATFFFNKSTAGNTYFPIWGTCLGLQLLSIIAADDVNVLTHGFDAYAPYPLIFNDQAKGSRIFSSMPSNVVNSFTEQNITMNLHHDGITPDSYKNSKKLNSFFNALSTNYDKNNKEFISTMESFKYPIYAVQWHPERSQFDFIPDSGVPHTLDAILAMQYTANFFVNECRKNERQIDQKSVQSLLVNNYSPINLEYGTEVYIFKTTY